MRITRLRNPSTQVLSADEMREYVRIDAAMDPLTLDILLGSAISYVESLCGQTLRACGYQIDYTCGGSHFDIPLNPVNSVTSVTVDGQPIDATGYELHCGRLTLAVPASSRLTVELDAGHIATSEIPESLRHAVIVLVAAGYDGRDELKPNTLVTVDRLCAAHRVYSL